MKITIVSDSQLENGEFSPITGHVKSALPAIPALAISAKSVDRQGHGALILGHFTAGLDAGVAGVEAAILPQEPVVRPGEADPVRAHELQGGCDAVDVPLLDVLHFALHLGEMYRYEYITL